MPHYRLLHHFDHWLSEHILGQSLLAAEVSRLKVLSKSYYGRHALLIGMPCQQALLQSTPVALHTVLYPFAHDAKTLTMLASNRLIESDYHDLPIQTASVDLLILPHTHEFVGNPHQLMREACRVVKPDGVIIVFGFHPLSLWRMRKLPVMSSSMSVNRIQTWLELADFEVEKKQTLLVKPLTKEAFFSKKFAFLEQIALLSGLGSLYVLVARAKVMPLTPMRWQWKQALNPMNVSTVL